MNAKISYTTTTSYKFSEDEVLVRDTLYSWRLIFLKWDQFEEKNKHRAKAIIRSGVPPSIRGEAWKVLSGAAMLKYKNPGVYETLVQQSDYLVQKDLKKDVYRTFPTNKKFKIKEGKGQRSLYNVLKVYSLLDPEVGYCQGMSFLTAVIISYVKNESDAFWVLVSLLKGFNLRGLYLPNLPLLKCYLYRFYFLVTAYMPALAKHLNEQAVSPLFYASEWFTALFSYNFSLKLTSRIWDVLMYEGPEYLFRIALAILKVSEEHLLQLSFDGIMLYLKQKTPYLDAGILKIADKFTGLHSLIEKIDLKWELVKDRVLSPTVNNPEKDIPLEVKTLMAVTSEESSSQQN